MKRRLIVFAKQPRPGYAKTRLASGIGPEAAAGVYARILYQLLTSITGDAVVAGEHPNAMVPELSLASQADVAFFAEAFPEFTVRAQSEGDLGQRLEETFRDAFGKGAERVVTVASDTPLLGPPLIRAAFEALDKAPIVLGPCTDGGYYLIGQRPPGARLFTGVDWGTDRVLAQTEALARAQRLEVARLPELFDVDTAEDLAAWREILMGRG